MRILGGHMLKLLLVLTCLTAAFGIQAGHANPGEHVTTADLDLPDEGDTTTTDRPLVPDKYESPHTVSGWEANLYDFLTKILLVGLNTGITIGSHLQGLPAIVVAGLSNVLVLGIVGVFLYSELRRIRGFIRGDHA